jgi:hypothetical protein
MTTVIIGSSAAVPALNSVTLDGQPPWLPLAQPFPFNVPTGQTLYVKWMNVGSKRIRRWGEGSRNSGAIVLIGDGHGNSIGGLPPIYDQEPMLVFDPPIPVAGGCSLYQGHFDNQGPEDQNMILLIGGFLE